ncbi:MAG TPA: phospholipid carrier-dependent glycosyltransferase [Anaerolineales bacterium]|nr:phospholipid carrier-dependent glycosyltransferase [Anaerolineales bacterium]
MQAGLGKLAVLWKENITFRRTALAVILWGIMAILLLPSLGYPRAIVFDETYMIPRAQRYMQGIFFQESHPPLGRLAIALGQLLVHPNERPSQFALDEKIHDSWPQDQDMTGYRLIPALFGTLIPIVVFFIFLKISGVELYSFIVGLFVAFDNALLTQAHFALSDSILIGFSLLSILAFVHVYSQDSAPTRATRIQWIIWGVFSAAALLVKFSTWFILVLVPVYLLKLWLSGQRRELLLFSAIFGVSFLTVTIAIWQLHFSLVPKLDPNNTYEIPAEHLDILEGKSDLNPVAKFYIELRDALVFIAHYHEGVPKLDLTKPDEIGSAWYQWPVGGRAIDYRWETPDGKTYRYIYLIGNPATWLISLLGVLGGTGLTISDLLFRFLPAERRKWPYVFTLLYWAYMIPPMFVQRVLYLYHYLPPLVIGVILFGIVVIEATRLPVWAKRDMLLLSLILVLVGFWMFKPFTYYGPLTNEQFQQLNVWPAWDLKCANCSNN